MTKKKNNKLLITGGIVGAVLLILIISVFIAIRSPTTPAYLNIEDGVVEVDVGAGWQGASDGMELSLSDKVRTQDGTAILVLYESIIVNLQENTEVEIAQLAKDEVGIEQNSGTTWNKFTKLAGVASYEVETPNTVATVRGTEFENGMSNNFVGSGNVDYKAGGKLAKLTAGMSAAFNNGEIDVSDLTEEQKARMIEYKKTILKTLRSMRAREINKNPKVYALAKKIAGLTDEEARIKIAKMDWGIVNEDKIIEKAPFKPAALYKFVGLTKEIKKEKQSLEKLGYFEPRPSWMGGSPPTGSITSVK